MKMQTPRSVRSQAGFTLIELIVVIVILGILAATALPKFADLGGDARYASMKAAEASLKSVSAMAHARALTTANQSATINFEGTTITLVNGYPGVANLAAAAGLSNEDFAIGEGTTLTISPKSVASDKVATCKLVYTPATNAANDTPKITLTASPGGC